MKRTRTTLLTTILASFLILSCKGQTISQDHEYVDLGLSVSGPPVTSEQTIPKKQAICWHGVKQKQKMNTDGLHISIAKEHPKL